MKRRSRAGGKPAKRRNTVAVKRRDAPKAARNTSAADQETEVARLTRELNEAREQQTATADVLQLISSSPGALEQVFLAILKNATRICEAKFGNLWLREGDTFRIAATHGAPPAYREYFDREPVVHPDPRSGLGVIFKTKRLLHIADIKTESTFKDKMRVATIELANGRSLVGVPLLKQNEVVGGIAIYRQEVRPFTDKQIELVKNFAAQAVIAIENARLLNELRGALERQTATSEVLQVISGSPGDLEPVFRTMLANATRICEAHFGVLHLNEGEVFRTVAFHNAPPEYVEAKERDPMIRYLPPTSALARLKETRLPVQIADIHQVDAYNDTQADNTSRLAFTHLTGGRTLLAIPMVNDEILIGAIMIYRQEVRPFSDKQIELMQNFAAQAVIAIENARLLSELRQSLEQQTATSDVLRIISSSPGDLEPVFRAMLENATRICAATYGVLYLYDGQHFALATHIGAGSKLVELMKRAPISPHPDTILSRIVVSKGVIEIEDARKERGYLERNPVWVAGVEEDGALGLLGVPMLKENILVGAFVIFRSEVGPFTDKQIVLVTNFAAQAVIAIENARLLSELRQRTADLTERTADLTEALEQQTATSEVLQVISSSPGDVEPVFSTMLENAVRICDAKFGNINRWDGEALHVVATHNTPLAFAEVRRRLPIRRPGPNTPTGRMLASKTVIHVANLVAEQTYTERDPRIVAAVELGGIRTFLAVPILKENELIGSFNLSRQEVRPFTDKQIALVTNFAAQAVIAIENARLLSELHQRTDDLSASLDGLRTAQDRLVQTEKLASLGQLTAGIAHEIKNPLNFVNNFSTVSVELIDELRETLGRVKADGKTRAEIAELTDTLRSNLDKVVRHGQRADSIVKNMLLHSRQGSGEHRPVDVNTLVDESLNLAYHGARAEKQGFSITIERSFDPAAGEVDLFPQDITRVLLNLISNGFYAATKRSAEMDGADYEPTLSAATKDLGDRVEIRIRDNGTGIPPEVKDKMFDPFFTTKPAGEGTGLGLSISHDIVVKQHAGSIEVETEPGAFTEFRIVLPRTAASIAKSGRRA